MDYITFCSKENLISSSFLVHFRPHTGFTMGVLILKYAHLSLIQVSLLIQLRAMFEI